MKTNVWFWLAAVLIVSGLAVLLTPWGTHSTPVLYVLLPSGAAFAGMFLVSRLMDIDETADESTHSAATKDNHGQAAKKSHAAVH